MISHRPSQAPTWDYIVEKSDELKRVGGLYVFVGDAIRRQHESLQPTAEDSGDQA